MTLPTRTPMFSFPLRHAASRAASPAPMGASSASVACSSASRLRARSWAKRSLTAHDQACSPGYASQRISARSVSSNIERCTAPELMTLSG